ncbi:hypothetical protein V1512DRAFT_213260, partial [Lipomyces arxii]|uniref:uncharacterized protein n=1 Tax=Lipomyces arxii TaxID=56418 RepID=UPI0034CD28FA
LNSLEQQQGIQRAVAIETYLNPPTEAVVDTDEDVIDEIVAQFEPQDDHESDEDLEVIPKITTAQVLFHMEQLDLHMDQQEEPQQHQRKVKRMLNSYRLGLQRHQQESL